MLNEDFESLLGFVLGNEETRRLGEPPDAAKLEDGRNDLNECDGSPTPVVSDGRGSPTDDRDNYGMVRESATSHARWWGKLNDGHLLRAPKFQRQL